MTNTIKIPNTLPWRIRDEGVVCDTLDCEGDLIFSDAPYDNFAPCDDVQRYIVHTANSYPALLAKLKELVAAIDDENGWVSTHAGLVANEAQILIKRMEDEHN